MLIMLTFINTLPNERQKYRRILTINSVEITIEKERKKVKNVFITNVLGSKVARYVVRRQLTSYLNPNTASGPDRSDQGKLLAQWKHHKIPEISICQRRRFSDS